MEQKHRINNDVYEELGARWYEADDDPVALLRAESRLRNQWVAERIQSQKGCVLDLGCGAGFLANELAWRGLDVVGMDVAENALEVARQNDVTGNVHYLQGDAYQLPFENEHFTHVCAMDFLEHVEDPKIIVSEAARVLKPGGSFYFYTFNRNWLSYLLVIKGVEWFVRNTPENLHVYDLFIKPDELFGYCRQSGLQVVEWAGVRPRLFQRPMLRLLLHGTVSSNFGFTYTNSHKVAYMGRAQKQTG